MKPDHDITNDELELIEKYLSNGLAPDDSRAFDTKMRTDANWTRKMEEVRLLLAGVQEASLKQRLDSFHDELSHRNNQGGAKFFRLHFKWVAAASVLLLISVATWLLVNQKNQQERLYADYYQPDPGLLTAMGPAEDYEFEKAMVDYKSGEYKKAIETWSSLHLKTPGNDTLSYFLGVAHQATGNDDEARKFLESVVKNSNHPFFRDACWYFGLLLLKNGETARAASFIERSNHDRKAELLATLKKQE